MTQRYKIKDIRNFRNLNHNHLPLKQKLSSVIKLNSKNAFNNYLIYQSVDRNVKSLLTWLKKNNYHKPLFNKFTDYDKLIERIIYEYIFIKDKEYENIVNLKQLSDNKYLELFNKIIDQYPYPKKEKSNQLNNHYIYRHGEKILILANIGNKTQQLILYNNDTDTIVYGQCIKAYKILYNYFIFDGKHISYCGRSRSGYELIQCKSLAPYFTAINKNDVKITTTLYDISIKNKFNGDLYQCDLSMFNFINVVAPYAVNNNQYND
jgi:hypothetical protein